MFGDAETTHIEIRTTDHNVVMSRGLWARFLAWPRISDINGERFDYAVYDAIRETDNAIAIYSHVSDRPYFARVLVRARVRWVHRLLILSLLVLSVATGLVIVSLPEDSEMVGSVGILVFPLTLAGTVILGRESSSLTERLFRVWKFFLLIAIMAVWLIALDRFVTAAGYGLLDSFWHGVKSLVSG